jgi:hypothetical protein
VSVRDNGDRLIRKALEQRGQLQVEVALPCPAPQRPLMC